MAHRYWPSIDDDGKIISVAHTGRIYGYLIGESGNIQQESTFFRRSLWDRTGGELDPKYPNAFDVGLWCGKFLQRQIYIS